MGGAGIATKVAPVRIAMLYVNVDFPTNRAIIHKGTYGHAQNRDKLEKDGYWNKGGFSTFQEAEEFGKASGMREVRGYRLKCCFG